MHAPTLDCPLCGIAVRDKPAPLGAPSDVRMLERHLALHCPVKVTPDPLPPAPPPQDLPRRA